jgi:predicted small secreted protein
MRCLLIFLCLVLCGCNIVRGIGQDTAAIGRTLTKISGTQSDQSSRTTVDTLPAAEPYDQTYVQPFEDQSYMEPSP